MNLKLEVTLLRNIYFALFVLGVTFVALMHTFERPLLDWFRVPTFIKMASDVNGLAYFPTFKIYQFTLVFSIISIFIDGLCLTKYKNKLLLKLSEWTTFAGAALMLLTIGYFLYNLFFVGEALLPTNLIFLGLATILVIVDIITFDTDKILEEKRHV